MTITADKKNDLKKAAVLFAYIALFVISIAAMTIYFSTDLIRPIVTEFKETMGWTTAEVNLLSSIYSFPPIIFLFFSGIFTDRFGIKKSVLMLMGLIVAGSIMVTFLSFHTILIGRLFIGMGAEGFFAVMNKIVTKWFKDKKLAMAFGLNLLVCRFGSISAFYILPMIVDSYSLKAAVWVGAVLTIVGFFLTLLYNLVDLKGDKDGLVAKLEGQSDEPFSVKDILKFPAAFWAITLLCMTYYSAIFPFTGVAKDLFVEKEKAKQVLVMEGQNMPAPVAKKIFDVIPDEKSLKDKETAEGIAKELEASNLFQSVNLSFDQENSLHVLNLSYEFNGRPMQKSLGKEFFTSPEFTKVNDTKINGARMTSIILIISMCVTWLFGLIVDKVGKRATLMIVGSLALMPCHLLLVFSDIPPVIILVVMGLSFSLVPACLWPAVPLIVKEKTLGTAYALIFMIQNIGLLIFEPLAAKFFDTTGNYKLSMIMFFGLVTIGLFFAIWLKVLEKKGGGYLDTKRAQVL